MTKPDHDDGTYSKTAGGKRRDELEAEARAHVDELERIRLELLDVEMRTAGAVSIMTPNRASGFVQLLEQEVHVFV